MIKKKSLLTEKQKESFSKLERGIEDLIYQWEKENSIRLSWQIHISRRQEY